MTQTTSSADSKPVRSNGAQAEATHVLLFPTGLGWIGLKGTARGLTYLTFGHSSKDELLAAMGMSSVPRGKEPQWMDEARDILVAYSRGEAVDLTKISLDVPHRTPFEKRVREQLARIGYGQTISYGQLAEAAGKPGAARAVGTIMAKNPLPLVIPCHRVLGAKGKLGGYSAPSGLTMKRRLLDLEAALKSV